MCSSYAMFNQLSTKSQVQRQFFTQNLSEGMAVVFWKLHSGCTGHTAAVPMRRGSHRCSWRHTAPSWCSGWQRSGAPQESSWTALQKKKRQESGCYCSFSETLWASSSSSTPPPPPPGVLCSAYLSKVRMRCVCKRRGRGRGGLGGISGGGRGEQGEKKRSQEKKKNPSSDRMENFC